MLILTLCACQVMYIVKKKKKTSVHMIAVHEQ